MDCHFVVVHCCFTRLCSLFCSYLRSCYFRQWIMPKHSRLHHFSKQMFCFSGLLGYGVWYYQRCLCQCNMNSLIALAIKLSFSKRISCLYPASPTSRLSTQNFMPKPDLSQDSLNSCPTVVLTCTVHQLLLLNDIRRNTVCISQAGQTFTVVSC